MLLLFDYRLVFTKDLLQNILWIRLEFQEKNLFHNYFLKTKEKNYLVKLKNNK